MFRGVIHVFEQFIQLAKIFFVISLVCFAPQILFKKPKKNVPSLFNTVTSGGFTLGIENVTNQYLAQICPGACKIGLVTQFKDTNVELLKEKNIEVARVFYPHVSGVGIINNNPVSNSDRQGVESCAIKRDGFGESLDDINLLLVDLQDVGIGYMASIVLLFQSLHAGVRKKIPIVILDRPNLLGNKIEGSLLNPSDVHAQVPLRYGMTLAELAHYYNIHALSERVNLHIVPMYNYNRSVSMKNVDDIVIPRIDSIDAAWGYSLCGMLAQVSPFDVGLDTDAPYCCIALPKSVVLPEQKWYQLKILLRNIGIESSICRYYSKQKKEACRGLRLHIKNMHEVDSFKALLATLEFFKKSGIILHFSDSFDQSVGSSLVRRYVQGKVPKKVLADNINQGLEDFYRKAFGTFMYHPLPQVVLV